VVFVLTVLTVFTLAAVARGQAKRKAGTAAHKATAASKSEDEIPKAEIKTIDVPDSIEWDFMLWTDASGKHQVRGKVLSIDGKEVRLEKEGGAILKVAIDKFCTADRKLLTAAYEAESEMQSEQTAGEKFRKDVEKASEVPADETTIRKQSLRQAQEEAFLKSYDGTDICLRFPIKDIEPARSGGFGQVPLGTYELSPEREASYGIMHWGNRSDAIEVRLSASEAAWVSKGDCLTIRGKANFRFGWPGRRMERNDFSYSRGNSVVCLTIDKPRYVIMRVNRDSSLNDKIKARAAELKAIEAKEEAAKNAVQRREEKANPFNDKK
jgi:hypothetical protein